MGPRIMYLHGLRSGSSSPRAAMIREVYGKDSVVVPDLKTRRALILFTIFFVIYVLSLCALALFMFLIASPVIGTAALLILTAIGVLTYILLGRGVTYYVTQSAIKIAEKSFNEFKPNILVCSSYGSVVALNMKVPYVSLVLLAPVQDAYCRYMRIRELPSLEGYPYCIIIHGSNDETVSLDDSIRLVETSDFGKCKLEVIDDDHSLRTLCEGDFEDFIGEAYEKGRDVVLDLLSKDAPIGTIKKSGSGAEIPKIDPALFDISSSENIKDKRETLIEVSEDPSSKTEP